MPIDGKLIAMIPARIGSERIRRKNLREIAPGLSLLGCAVQRCRKAECFAEVWVSTADDELKAEARRYGAEVHDRPAALARPNTSVAFKAEFCERHPDAESWVMVNPTGPLLGPETLRRFTHAWAMAHEPQDLLAMHTVRWIREVFVYGMELVNTSPDEHPETQTLPPVGCITWGAVALDRAGFLETHSVWPRGRTAWFEVTPEEGADIDEWADLDYARWLYARRHGTPLVERAEEVTT